MGFRLVERSPQTELSRSLGQSVGALMDGRGRGRRTRRGCGLITTFYSRGNVGTGFDAEARLLLFYTNGNLITVHRDNKDAFDLQCDIF